MGYTWINYLSNWCRIVSISSIATDLCILCLAPKPRKLELLLIQTQCGWDRSLAKMTLVIFGCSRTSLWFLGHKGPVGYVCWWVEDGCSPFSMGTHSVFFEALLKKWIIPYFWIWGNLVIYNCMVRFFVTKEIDTIKVPVLNKKNPRGVSMERYPILHPHRILAYLFDEVKIQIDPASVREYWDHARSMGQPWAMSSPASNEHIPLGLHGDNARLWTVHQIEKQMSVSLNLPLFRPRATRFSRFVVFTIANNKLWKNRTLNTVWRRLVWSINACFDGLHPSVGVGGGALRPSDARLALHVRTGLYAYMDATLLSLMEIGC